MSRNTTDLVTSLPFVANHQYNRLCKQHPESANNGEENKKNLQRLLHRKNIALKNVLRAMSIISEWH
jgi:hypothetical protein